MAADPSDGPAAVGAFAMGALVAGRFELTGEASHGPAGAELRALDREVDVEITLLVPAPGLFADPERAASLVAAGAGLFALQHPHLRRIFAIVHGDAGPVVSVQSGSREALLARHGGGVPCDDRELVRVAVALGGALDAAHDQGHAHGWLSPFDLIEVGGELKLSGVGLFRHADLDAARAAFAATTAYVAPEVWLGGPITPRSDGYSLAVILAELATGRSRLPLEELVAAVGDRDRRLGGLLARALARAPERRPEGGRGLVAELVRVLGPSSFTAPTAILTRVAPADAARAGSRGDLDDADEADGPGPLEDELAFAADQAPTLIDLRAIKQVAPRRAPGDDGAGGDGATIEEPSPLFKGGAIRPPEGLVARSPLDLADRPRLAVVSTRPASPVAGGAGPVGRPPPTAPGEVVSASASAGNARARRQWSRLGLVAVAVVVGAVAAVIAGSILDGLDGQGGQGGEAPATADDAAVVAALPPAPAAPLATGPCPAGMALVDGALRPPGAAAFCVDRWEAPGPGALPARVPHFTARAICAERGARLCTESEWEDACRGPGRSSWPYGAAFAAGRCNVKGRALEVAGARPACASAATAFDMSGNAAEWADEGLARGGGFDDGSEGRCSQRTRPRDGADLGFRCCTDPIAPPR